MVLSPVILPARLISIMPTPAKQPAHLLADFVQVTGLELEGEAVQVGPAGSE